MQINRPARPDEAPTVVGSDELAEGLMLVRESTLKMIRFQLAMERQDRRIALAAVDDLVALDGKLRDYLGHLPAPELEVERTALNREKLTLAAEVIRTAPKAPETLVNPRVATSAAGEWVQEKVQTSRAAAWWLAAVLLLLLAAALAIWFAAPGLAVAITGLRP